MKRYEDCENCHWLTCKKEDLEHRLHTLLTALKKHGVDRWHYEDCEYDDEDIETCDCGGKELARVIADCDHKTPDKKTEPYTEQQFIEDVSFDRKPPKGKQRHEGPCWRNSHADCGC